MSTILQTVAHRISFYYLISFVASMLILAQLVLRHTSINSLFFPALFFYGNYLVIQTVLPFAKSLRNSDIAALLTFHHIALLAISYTLKMPSLYYLGFIPYAGLTFFFLDTRESFTKLYFSLSTLCVGMVAASHGAIEFFSLLAFSLWPLSLKMNFRSKPLFTGTIPLDSKSEQKNRLFFHDIINTTHGLALYLSEKVHGHQPLSVKECEAVVQEIKLLQALMKDHFGYEHRNLRAESDMVPFDFAKQDIFRLAELFLGDHVRISFEFENKVDKNHTPYIHYPTIHRVVTNLIKNVADAKSEELSTQFYCNNLGVTIKFKNKLLHELTESEDIVNRLASIIKTTDFDTPLVEGVGLESIAILAHAIGGEATYSTDGKYWESTVYLPFGNSIQNYKVAA